MKGEREREREVGGKEESKQKDDEGKPNTRCNSCATGTLRRKRSPSAASGLQRLMIKAISHRERALCRPSARYFTSIYLFIFIFY